MLPSFRFLGLSPARCLFHLWLLICVAPFGLLAEPLKKYPSRVGVPEVVGPNAERFLGERPGKGMPPEVVTVAEVLETRGYATALIGKWHLGHWCCRTPCRTCPWRHHRLISDYQAQVDGDKSFWE